MARKLQQELFVKQSLLLFTGTFPDSDLAEIRMLHMNSNLIRIKP